MFELLELGIDVFLMIVEMCFDRDLRKSRRAGQRMHRPTEKWVTR